MNTEKFEEIKKIILDRAKEQKACTEQYKKAYTSNDFAELCNVIKDNFGWCCVEEILDKELLTKYKENFAAQEIFINTYVERGYLFCDNATVKAYGNAYIISFDAKDVKLNDYAIFRTTYTNTIYYASNNIKFVKQIRKPKRIENN